MRTLSAALNSAHGGVVQKPAWLVEITLSSVTRLSSFGSPSWDGHAWTQADINVASLRVGALEISGTLVLGNADDTFAALALGESFSDKRVRIWGFDATIASPLGADDPVLVCDAVGGAAIVAPDYVRVSLRDACEYRIGPRATVSPAFGFNTLLPAGRTVTINGITFQIQRGR